jgi:hypothetical protein
LGVEEFIGRLKTGLLKRSDNYSLTAVYRWKTAKDDPHGAISQPGRAALA